MKGKRGWRAMVAGVCAAVAMAGAGCDMNVANEGDHDNTTSEDSHNVLNGDAAIQAAAATNEAEVATNETAVTP